MEFADLSLWEGLLFVGTRLVVPKELRNDMMKLLREGHRGREFFLMKMIQYLFLSRITKDIDGIVENCEICLKFQIVNQNETLHPHEVPYRP